MSSQQTSPAVFVAPNGLLIRAGRAVTAAVGLALVPKCPLCVAAYLVSFGLSTGVAAFAAPFIRPAAWVFVAATCAGLAYGGWQRRVHRRRAVQHAGAGCCRE